MPSRILAKVCASAQDMAIACETVRVNDFPAEDILPRQKPSSAT